MSRGRRAGVERSRARGSAEDGYGAVRDGGGGAYARHRIRPGHRPRTADTRGVAGGADPLGARFRVGPDGVAGTNFALWAGGAEAVELCLFDEDGTETRPP